MCYVYVFNVQKTASFSYLYFVTKSCVLYTCVVALFIKIHITGIKCYFYLVYNKIDGVSVCRFKVSTEMVIHVHVPSTITGTCTILHIRQYGTILAR